MNGKHIYLIDGRQPQPGPVPVFKVEIQSGRMEPLRSWSQENEHSPDGFNVGYGGSGPMQLAYAICRDFLGSRRMAMSVYRRFCRTCIERIPQGVTYTLGTSTVAEYIQEAWRRASS